jgi:hypothetical protein
MAKVLAVWKALFEVTIPEPSHLKPNSNNFLVAFNLFSHNLSVASLIQVLSTCIHFGLINYILTVQYLVNIKLF